jgi:hypothetical protein
MHGRDRAGLAGQRGELESLIPIADRHGREEQLPRLTAWASPCASLQQASVLFAVFVQSKWDVCDRGD